MDKKNKIIIIGGIAAGASAAAKARRYSEEAEIVLYEKDSYISYGTCGLPYFISGKIDDYSSLLLNTPSLFEKRFGLKVRTLHEVLKIFPERNSILARDLKTGKEFEDHYDNLIVATGSVPIRLKLDGSDSPNVFTLKTIDDGLGIKEFLQRPGKDDDKNKSAVIIGGGFIGLELLEAFLGKGFKVSIIEKSSRILPVFDREMVEYLENYLAALGIKIYTGDEVKRLETGDGGIVSAVETVGGRNIKADIVFFGIGTKPDAGLAAGSGIRTGSSGAIEVDSRMRTNFSNIYAAGDCCYCKNLITSSRGNYNLASIANRQGRVAGYNAAGGNREFDGSVVTSIIKILDLALAKTGLGLKEAAEAGFSTGHIELHYPSHAGYYPGATMIHMMIIFKKVTGEIIGFQAIGKNGVDKRTDIISLAIKNKLKVQDLADLDLGYQPAYGSARDPVNILGMIGENLKKDEVAFIGPDRLKEKIADGQPMIILDVRTKKEFDHGHIEGAVHIPIDGLRDGLYGLDKDIETIIYCRSGYRAYLGLRILRNRGFKQVRLLNGSYLSWARRI